MSNLLVVLGAGASHDALEEGNKQPPVTEQIFDADYDLIQRDFTGVDGLRRTIIARVKRGQALEEVLGDLARNRNPNIRRQMFEMPLYLKRLLGEFTSESRAGTYDQLITLVQDRGLSVTFATLNYDTLLDEAIERKYNVTLNSLQDYIAPNAGRDWEYIKFHGSVNWCYPTSVPINSMFRVDRHVKPYLESTAYDYDRVFFDTSKIRMVSRNVDLSLGGVLGYPALAVPADQKNAVVCPMSHVEALRQAIASNPAVLVIGNRGMDADLMDTLQQSSWPGSRKPFHVVEPRNSVLVSSKFAEALNRGGFSVSPDMRFREFVESDVGERFFDEVRQAS